MSVWEPDKISNVRTLLLANPESGFAKPNMLFDKTPIIDLSLYSLDLSYEKIININLCNINYLLGEFKSRNGKRMFWKGK